MQNQKYELGEKIRKLREEKNLTRETFCNDESELTIRQLARIEKGESFPSFSKLKYISSTLGVPISVIIDESQMILPSRYLELKHRLIHFMTYGDEERMNLKDALFSDIYNFLIICQKKSKSLLKPCKPHLRFLLQKRLIMAKLY